MSTWCWFARSNKLHRLLHHPPRKPPFNLDLVPVSSDDGTQNGTGRNNNKKKTSADDRGEGLRRGRKCRWVFLIKWRRLVKNSANVFMTIIVAGRRPFLKFNFDKMFKLLPRMMMMMMLVFRVVGNRNSDQFVCDPLYPFLFSFYSCCHKSSGKYRRKNRYSSSFLRFVDLLIFIRAMG